MASKNLIDTGKLLEDLRKTAGQVLKKDVGTYAGFSEKQLRDIVKQAAELQQGIIAGEISKENEAYFSQGIKDMTVNFANTLEGLALVTVEKLWNAIVDAVWAAIEKGIGTSIQKPK
ncbi:hypothetical protein EHQ52_13315 [Leptospira koniambonensis]|uniref:Uncharacterized protein n=1 Tax=Leptospira koniambonensis TaxID=2484950 RepID=A0A4R9J9F7_9LEPT|nr:hypothetical protein [Leptospira koniambonensis]TGL35436.1 hypothetical protein EHQ52_13315 [Leptospira koniambonensis]